MNELCHYGVKYRSGRYPYGSGERPYQSGGPKLTSAEKKERNARRIEVAKRVGLKIGKAAGKAAVTAVIGRAGAVFLNELLRPDIMSIRLTDYRREYFTMPMQTANKLDEFIRKTPIKIRYNPDMKITNLKGFNKPNPYATKKRLMNLDPDAGTYETLSDLVLTKKDVQDIINYMNINYPNYNARLSNK